MTEGSLASKFPNRVDSHFRRNISLWDFAVHEVTRPAPYTLVGYPSTCMSTQTAQQGCGVGEFQATPTPTLA